VKHPKASKRSAEEETNQTCHDCGRAFIQIGYCQLCGFDQIKNPALALMPELLVIRSVLAEKENPKPTHTEGPQPKSKTRGVPHTA